MLLSAAAAPGWAVRRRARRSCARPGRPRSRRSEPTSSRLEVRAGRSAAARGELIEPLLRKPLPVAVPRARRVRVERALPAPGAPSPRASPAGASATRSGSARRRDARRRRRVLVLPRIEPLSGGAGLEARARPRGSGAARSPDGGGGARDRLRLRPYRARRPGAPDPLAALARTGGLAERRLVADGGRGAAGRARPSATRGRGRDRQRGPRRRLADRAPRAAARMAAAAPGGTPQARSSSDGDARPGHGASPPRAGRGRPTGTAGSRAARRARCRRSGSAPGRRRSRRASVGGGSSSSRPSGRRRAPRSRVAGCAGYRLGSAGRGRMSAAAEAVDARSRACDAGAGGSGRRPHRPSCSVLARLPRARGVCAGPLVGVVRRPTGGRGGCAAAGRLRARQGWAVGHPADRAPGSAAAARVADRLRAGGARACSVTGLHGRYLRPRAGTTSATACIGACSRPGRPSTRTAAGTSGAAQLLLAALASLVPAAALAFWPGGSQRRAARGRSCPDRGCSRRRWPSAHRARSCGRGCAAPADRRAGSGCRA